MTAWENGRRQVGPFTLILERFPLASLPGGTFWMARAAGHDFKCEMADTEAEAMAAADAWALGTIRAMSEAMGVGK